MGRISADGWETLPGSVLVRTVHGSRFVMERNRTFGPLVRINGRTVTSGWKERWVIYQSDVSPTKPLFPRGFRTMKEAKKVFQEWVEMKFDAGPFWRETLEVWWKKVFGGKTTPPPEPPQKTNLPPWEIDGEAILKGKRLLSGREIRRKRI